MRVFNSVLFCVPLIPFVAPLAFADTPRTMRHYIAEHGGGANVSVPRRPLSPNDVDRWARILGASEPQRAFMESMYSQFVDQHNEYMDREAPRYLALSAELSAAIRSEGLSSPEVLRLTVAMDRENSRVRHELTAIEHRFIDLLAPVLSEEQEERLLILRKESTRRNCRIYHSDVRWAHIELRDVWDTLIDQLAGPNERMLLDDILADYEVQLTSFVCRNAELLFETRQRLFRNRLESHTVTPEEGRARYARVMKRSADGGRRVQDLHIQVLRRVSVMVPSEVASPLIDAAKRAAFPELYPDSAAIHAVFEALIESAEFDDEAKESVAMLFELYAHEYDRKCNELEGFCVDWGERAAEGENGYQPQFLPQALKPLLEERVELSRQWLFRIDDVLGPEWRQELSGQIPSALRKTGEPVGSS